MHSNIDFSYVKRLSLQSALEVPACVNMDFGHESFMKNRLFDEMVESYHDMLFINNLFTEKLGKGNFMKHVALSTKDFTKVL